MQNWLGTWGVVALLKYYKHIYTHTYMNTFFALYTCFHAYLVVVVVFTASAIIIWRLFSRRRIRQCKQFPALDHVLLRQQHRQFPKFDVSNYHIEVVETAEACEEYLSTKIPSPLSFVGLDCEWCNEQRGSGIPVALLQLAFPNKECLLVRLCKMGDLTPTLTEILEDKRYYCRQAETIVRGCGAIFSICR